MSDRKPKFFKKFQAGIKTFYCFELKGSSNYILYDKNLRNPIEWGSINVIDGLLATIPDDNKVIYFDSSEAFGFKKSNRKKPKFNESVKNDDFSGKDSVTQWVGFDDTCPTFYYFQLENGKVAMFDEKMGQPIILNNSYTGYAPKSKVDYIVTKHIKNTSDIFYFKQIQGELKSIKTIKGKR